MANTTIISSKVKPIRVRGLGCALMLEHCKFNLILPDEADGLIQQANLIAVGIQLKYSQLYPIHQWLLGTLGLDVHYPVALPHKHALGAGTHR